MQSKNVIAANIVAEVVFETGGNLDTEDLKDLGAVLDSAGKDFPTDGLRIIVDSNPELYAKLNSLENQINSLMLINPKPPALKKEFKRLLVDYQKTILICAEYANKFLKN